MKKSMVLMSVLAVLMLAFSGCVGDDTPENPVGPEENSTGVLPGDSAAENLTIIAEIPSGFEYLASQSVSVEKVKTRYESENVSGILGGAQGVYKYSDGTDFYVHVVELEGRDAAGDLIFAYKSSFTPLKVGNRFVEEPFNGHFATKITDYITVGGEQVPRYSYLWQNENFVFLVKGNTEDSALIKELAEATGY